MFDAKTKIVLACPLGLQGATKKFLLFLATFGPVIESERGRKYILLFMKVLKNDENQPTIWTVEILSANNLKINWKSLKISDFGNNFIISNPGLLKYIMLYNGYIGILM